MTAALADYWPALCPALPAAWDTPVNRRNLADLTGSLAPIPRVALECRLADPAPTIELQQCIRRDHGEPALLRNFLLASQPAARESDGPWARLHRFCAAWSDPTTLLHRGITEVFLEHDLDPAPQPALPPSVFISVSETDGEAAAEAALALLLPAPWPPGLADNLAGCFAACPAGASVSHLGVMLGRATEAVRVNVKRLGLDELVPFLKEVGWNGPLEAAEHWAGWAYDRVDRVTVCLDVGPDVHPHLGLECVLAIQPPREPRWRELLEELSREGLCTAANAAALLAVPGALSPPEAHGDWPAAWIVATLAAPADHFSTTERQLSHVKVTVAGEQVVAKGYWGAGHVWRTPGRGTQAAVPGNSESVAQALSGAIDFLLSRQAHTGRWSDFLLPAGPSDEWVTAFVGACLLTAPGEETRRAARRAWAALLRRRPDEPGWGYNRLTPADADSTAWALRLAGGLRIVEHGRVAAARAFLAGHVSADGGITTYAERGPIGRYTRLPEDASFAGWLAAHDCVTAAAAPLLGAVTIDYLGRQQGDAGNWQSYWWWDDEYTTALAAEALPASRASAAGWARARLAATGAVHSVDGEPSAWATAWCLRVLGHEPTFRADEARAVRWLVGAQQVDGSWPASARLRVPMPGQLIAAGQETINALDQNRVFTTAAVAAALATSACGRR